MPPRIGLVRVFGSSPRVRRTPYQIYKDLIIERFISARAENTLACKCMSLLSFLTMSNSYQFFNGIFFVFLCFFRVYGQEFNQL